MREYQEGFTDTGKYIVISDESGYHRRLPIVSGLQTFPISKQEMGWSDLSKETWRAMSNKWWDKQRRKK